MVERWRVEKAEGGRRKAETRLDDLSNAPPPAVTRRKIGQGQQRRHWRVRKMMRGLRSGAEETERWRWSRVCSVLGVKLVVN
jgi:hypothetical protein